MRGDLEDYLDDFVGYHAQVRRSSNSLQNGMNGIILDETKNTIVIGTSKGPRVIQKKGLLLDILKGQKKITLDMSVAIFRPEDRIRNHRKIGRRILRNQGKADREQRM